MILNELTNADAIEAVREETWGEAWNEAWEEASEVVSEATWKKARQQMLDLIDQGLTSEQLKQAIQSERSYVVPQTTKTERSKR
jgi:hypothetical protein